MAVTLALLRTGAKVAAEAGLGSGDVAADITLETLLAAEPDSADDTAASVVVDDELAAAEELLDVEVAADNVLLVVDVVPGTEVEVFWEADA